MRILLIFITTTVKFIHYTLLNKYDFRLVEKERFLRGEVGDWLGLTLKDGTVAVLASALLEIYKVLTTFIYFLTLEIISYISDKNPTASQLMALEALILCGEENGHISKNYSLIGHRQTGKTDCPGNKMFRILKNMPNFNSNPKK